MHRTDYEAVNAKDVVIRTFSDRQLARAWVKENAHQHDGLRVDVVETTVNRRRDYRPQIRVVA